MKRGQHSTGKERVVTSHHDLDTFRKVEIAFIWQSTEKIEDNVYGRYQQGIDTIIEYGGNTPQLPPLRQRQRVNLSSFFQTMPNFLDMSRKLQNGNDLYSYMVLSLGITSLSGGGVNLDGTYMASCRALMNTLESLDMVRIMQESPARYVYTGMRLFDLLFKFILDWLRKHQDISKVQPRDDENATEHTKQMKKILIRLTTLQKAIDEALFEVWDSVRLLVQNLNETGYSYCDSRTYLTVNIDSPLYFALDALLESFKAVLKKTDKRYVDIEEDNAVKTLSLLINEVLTAKHPIYLPIVNERFLYSPPNRIFSVKEQMDIFHQDNEAAIRNLDAAAVAGTAISVVLLEPVLSTLNWPLLNATAIHFVQAGIGITLVSMVLALLSYVPFEHLFNKYISSWYDVNYGRHGIDIQEMKPTDFQVQEQRIESGEEVPQKKYSLQYHNLQDYKCQMKHSARTYASALNDCVPPLERIQLHSLDLMLADQLIKSARRRYLKRGLTVLSVILMIVALCLYGTAAWIYASIPIYILLVSFLVLLIGVMLFYTKIGKKL